MEEESEGKYSRDRRLKKRKKNNTHKKEKQSPTKNEIKKERSVMKYVMYILNTLVYLTAAG